MGFKPYPVGTTITSLLADVRDRYMDGQSYRHYIIAAIEISFSLLTMGGHPAYVLRMQIVQCRMMWRRMWALIARRKWAVCHFCYLAKYLQVLR